MAEIIFDFKSIAEVVDRGKQARRRRQDEEDAEVADEVALLEAKVKEIEAETAEAFKRLYRKSLQPAPAPPADLPYNKGRVRISRMCKGCYGRGERYVADRLTGHNVISICTVCGGSGEAS